jgi:hypothetical protein
MKIGVALSSCFLLLAAGSFLPISSAASDTPRVGRAMLAASERSLDERVSRLWDDNPFVLLGPTRGIYLEGYGVVLTAEINLVTAPLLPVVNPLPGKEEVAKHRLKKIERLPELRRAMRQVLMDTAVALDSVPGEQQIVVVTFLSRYPWEDTSGVPVEVMMRAQRKKLLDVQHAGNTDSAAQSAIEVTEF